MTYHHAVGVTASSGAIAGDTGEGFTSVHPLVPTKPFVALLGFLCIVGLIAWVMLGRAIAGAYYNAWARSVHQELANANAPLWTLYRGRSANAAARLHPAPPHHTRDQAPLPFR
jgi:hypothetical protein